MIRVTRLPFVQNNTYLSGTGREGYVSCIILTTSEKWTTLSAMQYLPLADGVSNASTCARATSFTLVQPKLKLGYTGEPIKNRHK
jgi:hypothetical protein